MTKPRISLLPYLLTVIVPMSLGCDGQEYNWFSVEADVQELCVVGLSSEFEPVTDINGVVKRVFDGADLGIRLDERFSAELFLSGVGMASDGNGIANFDFIDSLRVEVSGGGSAPVELLNFDGVSAEEMGDDWFVAANSGVDMAQYIEADDLEILFEFSGDLPTRNWTADMEICFAVNAKFAESL